MIFKDDTASPVNSALLLMCCKLSWTSAAIEEKPDVASDSAPLHSLLLSFEFLTFIPINDLVIRFYHFLGQVY